MNRRQQAPLRTTLDLSELQLLAIPEVAKLLQVSRTMVYALMSKGEIESIKIGNARRVVLVSVWQYIERQKQVS